MPDELVTAKSKGKPIFPLLLDDTELFLALQMIQFEDVRGGRLPSQGFYLRLATVTLRRKKASVKVDSIRLVEQARQKKVDEASQRASYYRAKFSNYVKDMLAVTSRVSSDTYNAVANSEVMKRLSSSVKQTTTPIERKTAPKKTTRKKKQTK